MAERRAPVALWIRVTISKRDPSGVATHPYNAGAELAHHLEITIMRPFFAFLSHSPRPSVAQASRVARLVTVLGVASALGVIVAGTGCSSGEIAIGSDEDALKNGPGSCTYEGKRYANHATFRSSDNCNGCGCTDGAVACTAMACALDAGAAGSCTYDGKTYPNGASYPSDDGCNSCSCNAGSTVCTLRACAAIDAGPPKACTYGGKSYAAGESFPSTDGCNGCSCQPDGQVICTLRACALDAGGPG